MDSKEQKGKNTGLRRRTFISALVGLPFLASIAELPAEAALNYPPFSFVYVTDVHLCNGVPDNQYKMLQESQLFLQDAVKGINALKPDFVIFGGDQVETIGANEANWNFFLDIAQGLNSPWFFVLGEQDVSGKIPVDKMKGFGPDFKGRGVTGSDPYWSADPVSNVHLIGLDTAVANSTGGDLSSQQLEWLKSDLAANKGKFTIVITHHPLLPPAPYDGGPPWDEYILQNGADVREVLSSDVRLVLSGHVYVNKAQVERDAYHISCAGLNVYPCQYKYFRVTKEAVLMESFDLSFTKLVDKAEQSLISSAMASKMNRKKPDAVAELFRGNDEDQHAILSLTGAKTIRAISKKQVKEDLERRDAELEKQAELARNKGKGKGKKDDKDNDKGGKSDKGDKAEKSGKGDKAEKSKGEKSEQDEKSDKSESRKDGSKSKSKSKSKSSSDTKDSGSKDSSTNDSLKQESGPTEGTDSSSSSKSGKSSTSKSSKGSSARKTSKDKSGADATDNKDATGSQVKTDPVGSPEDKVPDAGSSPPEKEASPAASPDAANPQEK